LQALDLRLRLVDRGSPPNLGEALGFVPEASIRVSRVNESRSGSCVLLMFVLALVTSGCGHLGSAENATASKAALAFDQSLDTPARACAMLAPGTLTELEEAFGKCDDSLPRQHLPAGTSVVDVDVYGKDAIVRLDHDVVFLARFDDGWRVTAAGCTPQPNRPFHCILKGQ
jgi:hypothetical protein